MVLIYSSSLDPYSAIQAEYVYLIGLEHKSTEENTEALLEASKEVGLEVNTEKNKHQLFNK